MPASAYGLVALFADVIAAVTTAVLAAGFQRLGLRLLQAKQRGARGDGLA